MQIFNKLIFKLRKAEKSKLCGPNIYDKEISEIEIKLQ